MTVLSAQSIAFNCLLHPCLPRTEAHGLTYGLGPCGYDLRLDLGVEKNAPVTSVPLGAAEPFRTPGEHWLRPGDFLLAAALERFTMPDNIMGRVCDKSSLARRGLSVFNTVLEPGWRGYLTLELKNQGHQAIRLVQGQGIAQVIFEFLDHRTIAPYQGKYQDQESGPVAAR